MSDKPCDDKQHTGRNGLTGMLVLVKIWLQDGKITQENYDAYIRQHDRVIICTKLFGEPKNQLKEKGHENKD